MTGFWLCTLFMLVFAGSFIFLPLLRTKTPAPRTAMLLGIIFPLLAYLAYFYWGSHDKLHDYYVQQTQAKAVAAYLSKKSPAQIIADLKERVEQHPNRAKGWFLLGRLYFSQQDINNAQQAFHKAHELDPNDLETAIQYAQVLLLQNQGKLTPFAKALVNKVISQQPEHVLAMHLLAMDAYLTGQYQLAIQYWQSMLNHYPVDSPDRKMIVSAIEKARGKE